MDEGWQEKEPEFYEYIEDWLDIRITPEMKPRVDEFHYADYSRMKRRQQAWDELGELLTKEIKSAFPFKQIITLFDWIESRKTP